MLVFALLLAQAVPAPPVPAQATTACKATDCQPARRTGRLEHAGRCKRARQGSIARYRDGATLEGAAGAGQARPAAMIEFRIAKAGRYGIALDQPGWIDVLPGAAGGAALASVAHGHGTRLLDDPQDRSFPVGAGHLPRLCERSAPGQGEADAGGDWNPSAGSFGTKVEHQLAEPGKSAMLTIIAALGVDGCRNAPRFRETLGGWERSGTARYPSRDDNTREERRGGNAGHDPQAGAFGIVADQPGWIDVARGKGAVRCAWRRAGTGSPAPVIANIVFTGSSPAPIG